MGFDPSLALDHTLDPDADGFTNIEEYRLGSHPADAASNGLGQIFKSKVFFDQSEPGSQFGAGIAAYGDEVVIGA